MAKKNRKRGDCTIDRQDVNIVQILFVCYFVCLLFSWGVCLFSVFVCLFVGLIVRCGVCLFIRSVRWGWVGLGRVGLVRLFSVKRYRSTFPERHIYPKKKVLYPGR